MASSNPLLFAVDDLEQLLTCPKIVLQGNRSLQSRDDVNVLLLCSADPVGKFECIWNCGGEQNKGDVLGQHDDDLFPYRAAVGVLEKVDLIEHHVTQVVE